MSNPYQSPQDLDPPPPWENPFKDAERRNLILFFAALLALAIATLVFAVISAIP